MGLSEPVAAMTPGARAALVDLMRTRKDQINTEITALRDEQQQIAEWLAVYGPTCCTDHEEVEAIQCCDDCPNFGM